MRSSTYDLTIKQGPVTRGYLLARAGTLGRGERRWSVEAAGASIAQQSPVEQQYGNQAPIVEIPMVFRSTHKGYGDARMVADDRYHYSANVDGRFPQQIIAGPYLNWFQTYLGGPCVGFFEQDDMVFFVGGLQVVYMQTDESSGTAKVFHTGETPLDCAVFDGKGYVGMGYGDSFYERVSDADPTLGWSQVDKDFQATITDDTQTISAAFQIAGELGVANGGAIPDVGDYFEVLGAGDFTADDLETAKGVAVVAGDFFRVTNNGLGTEAVAFMGNNLGLFMGYMSVFKDRLWASVTDHEVACVATAPTTAANWSAAYRIGDPGKPITALAELAELLYAGKTNGLFVLGADGLAIMATPELGSVVSLANCAQMGAWHGSMWVPHERGLFNYRAMGAQGFLVTPATPGAFATEDNPVKGKITALVGDDRWLYAALYTADGDTYILAGRPSEGSEQAFGPMVWHPLAHLPAMKVEAMHISGLWTNPRLFIPCGDNEMYYIILPRKGENPISDTAYKYALSGSISFPAHCWLSPTSTKLWKSIEIEGAKITAARYIEVYYRIDEGAWVLAGTINRSPRDIVALPAAGVPGTSIEIRLDLTLPDTSQTPRIYSIVIRGVERPPSIKVITVAIRCADGMKRNNQVPERRTGAEILLELEALAQLDEAVILTDTIGVERWVLVLPPIGEVETVQRDGQKPEKVAMVKMVVFEAEVRPGVGGAFIIGPDKDFDVTITDNTETISAAFQAGGELFIENGAAVPDVGDYFEVLGTGDFTADDLEAAKGDPVVAGDFFEVTNNGIGAEAVRWSQSSRIGSTDVIV